MEKTDFRAQKKALLGSNHVLARTGKSCEVRIGYESKKNFNGASYCSDPVNATPTGAVEDQCHYSNWTSCSYFCGDEKEDYSYRALLDDTPKARAECPIPKKPCDESVICTGDIYKPGHSKASFLFFTRALCLWSVDEN